MLKHLLLQIVTLLSLTALSATKYVKMSATALEIDSDKIVAVTLVNEKKWHTYWKNPGDAGLPVKIFFSLGNKEIKLQELEWPMPKRYIEQGEILAYGYSGSNTFFFRIPKNDYEKILEKILTIKGQWLVCKDICIPGEDEIELKFDKPLPVFSQGETTKTELLKSRYRQLPQIAKSSNKLDLALVKGDNPNTLALQYSYTNIDIDSFDKELNLLTPFLKSPLDYKREELVYDKETNSLFGRIIIGWDGEYEEPPLKLPVDGIFSRPVQMKFLVQDNGKEKTKVIVKDFSSFSLDGFEQHDLFLKSRSLEVSATKIKESGIWFYVLFAFLGGLILNLMPCVLPVISLKLFGLISHQNESKKRILKHNLVYSLGVWVTFMVLGVVVILLKLSGEQIGWGFQLQSPLFVFIMLLVIFIMSLNLFGLFEFITPGGRKLGGAQLKEGFFADFFNGVLATILSTPCSAPFLGVALTFAFTTNNFNIFFIFTSIAFGLAFPFILTGLFPSLISFFPRPGNWMVKLKYFLGLTMLITFAWLYDVLFALIDSSIYGISLHLLFVTLFFGYFLRRHITKKFLWNFIFFAIPLILFVSLYTNKGFDVSEQSNDIKAGSSLNWNKWSSKNLALSKNKGRWVFIDFTATWCLTCKVNKKLVLETDAFAKLVKKENIDLMVGDWTKRDEKITQFLRSYDIVGVPAYFLQSPEGKIIHLGETISISKIEDNLK